MSMHIGCTGFSSDQRFKFNEETKKNSCDQNIKILKEEVDNLTKTKYKSSKSNKVSLFILRFY